jgi:hypothetical protein
MISPTDRRPGHLGGELDTGSRAHDSGAASAARIESCRNSRSIE